jgi:hypothetical protein
MSQRKTHPTLPNKEGVTEQDSQVSSRTSRLLNVTLPEQP